MDRIDIHVEVPAVKYRQLADSRKSESSGAVQKRVKNARQKQTLRFRSRKGVFCNAHMGSRDIRNHCRISAEGAAILQRAIQKLGLSARAYDRIMKVSRTIADLDEEECIRSDHLAEAIQYRSLDRDFSDMI